MIKGKKTALAKLLDKFQLLGLFRKKNYPSLTILNYHRIYRETLTTDFDRGVFGPNVEEFNSQMKWLKENFKIISEKEILTIAENRKLFKNRSVCVTFDDAYIDNYTLAYPVLKDLNIPAIFFVPTGVITERKMGWWDLIAYLVKKCSLKTIILNDEKFFLSDSISKEKTIGNLFEKMKNLEASETINFVEILSQKCEVALPDAYLQSAELMTWDQIKEVSKNGITIGSHAHSHRVLSTLDPEEQKSEIVHSKIALEKNLSLEINSLAYPVGGYSSFNAQTKKYVKEAGYKIAFSFNTGINRNCVVDSYDIKRIGPPIDFSLFKASLIMPYLFAKLQNVKASSI